MSDPKLKEAMAEIMGVLKKHDIAGQVTLVSPTHSEFRIDIAPTWSCARMEPSGDGFAVRFKATKEGIPDDEARKKIASETAHMLLQIRDLCAQYYMSFDDLVKQLEEFMEIEHKPYSDYEPHREQ